MGKDRWRPPIDQISVSWQGATMNCLRMKKRSFLVPSLHVAKQLVKSWVAYLPRRVDQSIVVFALRPKCQTYAWGKDANSSIVAQFMAKNDPSFVIDSAQNYAEVCYYYHHHLQSI